MLVNNHRKTPTIICSQRNADKVLVTEDDLVESNIKGFGDDIGKITNRITSMFDVMSAFPEDSEEYRVLDYRIKCGQLLQQDAIDKVKGIIVNPMPKTWYERSANQVADDVDEATKNEAAFNLKIIADRKPYFMRYIYPDVMKKYKEYIKNTEKKAIREFRKTVQELEAQDKEELTEKETQFLYYYHARMPVGQNDCLMNRICRRFEEEFDHYDFKSNASEDFDYTILKSDQEYTQSQYYAVLKLYKHYVELLQNYMRRIRYTRTDPDEVACQRDMFLEDFIRECFTVCSNERQLCNIALDICYKSNETKSFCWGLFEKTICENLLERNGGVYQYPSEDADGDIEFAGMNFSMKTKEVSVDRNYFE